MNHNNFIRIVVSHLCDSSCILLSFSLLPSTFAFSFAEELGMFIEFVEAENSRPFFYILWFFYLSCAIRHEMPQIFRSWVICRLTFKIY